MKLFNTNIICQSRNKYNEIKTTIQTLLTSIDLQKFEKENLYSLSAFFHITRLFYNDFEIDGYLLEHLLSSRKEEDGYWRLVFSITPLMQKDLAINTVTREWFSKFYNGLKVEINSLGTELYGDAYPDFEELKPYEKLIKEKRQEEARLLKKKNKADFLQKTNKYWFPRYLEVREKMKVLKSSRPLGYKLHEELVYSFSLLRSLEDHESNRYFFNKEKGWW